MTNEQGIAEMISALSPERKEWLRTRATALVLGVFRAVGMPTEYGTIRLGRVFAETHRLNAGEEYLANDAMIAALVTLERKGRRSAPGVGTIVSIHDSQIVLVPT